MPSGHWVHHSWRTKPPACVLPLSAHHQTHSLCSTTVVAVHVVRGVHHHHTLCAAGRWSAPADGCFCFCSLPWFQGGSGRTASCVSLVTTDNGAPEQPQLHSSVHKTVSTQAQNWGSRATQLGAGVKSARMFKQMRPHRLVCCNTARPCNHGKSCWSTATCTIGCCWVSGGPGHLIRR